jgi:hypothetical protein
MFDVAGVGAEFLHFRAVLGELLPAAEALHGVGIAALHLIQVRVPPGYPAFIRAEDAGLNLLTLNNLPSAAFAEGRENHGLVCLKSFLAVTAKAASLTVASDGAKGKFQNPGDCYIAEILLTQNAN